MNTLVKAKLIDITCNLYLMVMLAAMVLLLNRMFRFYWRVLVRVIFKTAFCICTYARKRVIKRVIHQRKYAIFTIYPNVVNETFGKGRPKYLGYKNHQRGLLKDNTT